jgi:hypothetical protein
MKLSRHQAIRDILLVADDGLTISQIAQQLSTPDESIRVTIRNVWGVYIDRWTQPKRGQHAAVYMCIEVPENAPKPRSTQ